MQKTAKTIQVYFVLHELLHFSPSDLRVDQVRGRDMIAFKSAGRYIFDAQDAF